MVARQKDVKTFFKNLKKRYSDNPVVLSRDRKVLEHVVFAIFLENATFEQARNSFIALQHYFIDWNEIRIAKADEIARVINGKADELVDHVTLTEESIRVGERLRRVLQWIFDKTYKFELEDLRANGREEVIGFLTSIPYCTSFIVEYISLLVFGKALVPLDENTLRVLRLLALVSVKDDKEVVPVLEDGLKESEARDFFFALHDFACKLSDDSTRSEAMKFLVSFDSNAAKRSDESLVSSKTPSDPLEIARDLSRRERTAKAHVHISESAIFDEDVEDKSEDCFDESLSVDIEERGDILTTCSTNASAEASLTKDDVSFVSSGDKGGRKTRRGVNKTANSKTVVSSIESGSEKSEELDSKRVKRVEKTQSLKDGVVLMSDYSSKSGPQIYEPDEPKSTLKERVKNAGKSSSKKTTKGIEPGDSDAEVDFGARSKKSVKASSRLNSKKEVDTSVEVVKKTLKKESNKELVDEEVKSPSSKVNSIKKSSVAKLKDVKESKDKHKETKSVVTRDKADSSVKNASSEPPDQVDKGVGKTTKRPPRLGKDKS